VSVYPTSMNKHDKLSKNTKFPKVYQKMINMNRINFETIKPWIEKRITSIIGIEDEILTALIYNLLQDTQHPDPKMMHIQLMGFLESHTEEFMIELWTMLLNAQTY